MKIGIITHCYGSTNYGGRLQAFALCKALAKMNCTAEQICYPFDGELLKQPTWRSRLSRTFLYRCLRKIYRHYRAIPQTGLDPQMKSHVQAVFEKWSSQHIPHSINCFSRKTIGNCAKDYDVLITGSDQVWNLNWYSPAYFLDFAPSTVRKISYAASVCNDEFTDYQRDIVAQHLSDFKAVSVREADSIRLIEELSPVPVEVTLDPTLLLDRSDWDKIADERLVDEAYLFCYYIGSNPLMRSIARKYADAHNLKVVIIDHIEKWYVAENCEFADFDLTDITPGGFISLIKHADCVFTDSFHSCVFSAVYHKNVFVFGRSNHAAMSSRIHSIAGMFGFEDHFCDAPEKVTLDYIENCAAIDYDGHWDQYETEKKKSIDFLCRCIFSGKDIE